MAATVPYRSYDIPLARAASVAPPDQFAQVSDTRVTALRRHSGLMRARWIVEIGCGFGSQAIPLTEILPIDARYVGLDEDPEAVDWAVDNISARAPNFEFSLLARAEDAGATRLPFDDNSQDLVVAFAPFTRIYPDRALHLLREAGRILQPGGEVFALFHVIRPGLIQHLHKAGSSAVDDLKFLYMVDRGFYLNDPKSPASATGYSPRKIGSMARRARLVPTRLVKGGWTNDGPGEIEGPDAVVMTKPVL